MNVLAFGALTGVVILAGLLFLVRDVFKKMSGSSLIMLAGLILLFAGERLFGDSSWRVALTGPGFAVLFGALGLRLVALKGSHHARRAAHQSALWGTLVVLASLLLYLGTLPAVTGALGLSEEGVTRWVGAWSSLFPILTLVGLLPVLLIDRMLAAHPVILPQGAIRQATLSGVTIALSLALLFPVNYLASMHDLERDVAYFRTTRPGEPTISLVSSAAEPIEALLFFATGNDVAQQVEPYFKALASASKGQLTYRVVDQALDPLLAEELKIRDNGQIVFRQGENDQKIKISTEMARAKRDLRKLDGTVQTSLLKLTREQRNVYFLTGHGEASSRERENPLRKLNLYKKEVLEAQNYKVKSYSVADGSAIQVPDDAGVVIVAAPTEPLLPEEIKALTDWWDEGGSLLLLVEPGGEPLQELVSHLGLELGEFPLANAEAHLVQTRGKADNVLLASNKFGSHPAVRTLSRNSQQLAVVTPTVLSVQKDGSAKYKVSTLIRSFPDTWPDANGDRLASPGEEKKVYELAVAVEKGKGEDASRAIVVGDTNFLADDVLRYSKGNVVFGSDAIKWLVGDDDLAGSTENEEDVKIQHTRSEDTAWFLLSIIGIPLMVLGFGIVLVRIRGRNA